MRAVALVSIANGRTALTHYEQMPIVLGVESAVEVDREGRIGRADRKIGKELELGRGEDAAVTLVEYIDVAVLALDVHVAGPIYRWRVDTPLETIRASAVTNVGARSVSIPVAVPMLSALKLPLGYWCLADLTDEKQASR